MADRYPYANGTEALTLIAIGLIRIAASPANSQPSNTNTPPQGSLSASNWGSQK